MGIREDGSLDVEEGALAGIDVVRAEVVDPRGVPEKELTRRLCAAIRSGRVHVLARPTGVYPKDKPAQVDAEAIAKAAKEMGVLLELDGRPERLAGAEGFSRAARDAGATILIASHAESAGERERIRYGLDQARRGWCEAKDVVNTQGATALVELFARR